MASSHNESSAPKVGKMESSDAELIEGQIHTREHLPKPKPKTASLYILVEHPKHHESKLSQRVAGIDEADANSRYDVEAQDNKASTSPNSCSSSVNSVERKIIHWEDGDKDNPYNFSASRKITIVLIGAMVVVNSTMGSSLPSNAIPYIAAYFNISSKTAEILPISTYLIGYVVGPLMFGPLSESYGRRYIMVSTFFFFTIFTMACAVAPNWAALNIFRFFTGVFASSPIAVIGGIYADIYGNPVSRGRAMAVFIGVSIFYSSFPPC
jgi:hypothetical protein